MRIWILRHGEAERETRCDSARALTARGESDAKAAGIFLAGIAPASLAVFASPYKRAQQTALAAVQALSQQTITTADWLKPDTDPVAVIDALAQLPQRNLLLVSHQPLVSALAGVLIDGDNRAGPAMNTASLLELTLKHVAAGCAKLKSYRHAPDFHKAAI